MTQDNPPPQERLCRACQRRYAYPVRKSLATRFHCEACMALSPNVRKTFETFNKRIKALSAAVDKLEKELTTRRKTGGAVT